MDIMEVRVRFLKEEKHERDTVPTYTMSNHISYAADINKVSSTAYRRGCGPTGGQVYLLPTNHRR